MKVDFKIDFSKIKFLRKYDYDVNRVVGVEGNERYILLAEKKLLRIYRDKLKSTPLVCSFIPIENAIFYNFEVEKSVVDNVEFDLDAFVETKVYEEAGLSETEKYIIKYEVVDALKDDKNVIIQCVIVPEKFLKENYEYILKETGYIDYLSFPAFAYKALYEEEVLKKGNDLFVVMLHDKIFFTFYSGGRLIYINTVSGGLNKIYESLKELNIANFDKELFKKLITRKGIDIHKYIEAEKIVFDVLSRHFKDYARIIEEQILNLLDKYIPDEIDRIFVTTEYGEIPGITSLYTQELKRKVFGFEFYEEYNLDKLPIDPFLFLAMLETHKAYEENDLKFNFSLYLRKPTFFYRPSGILILTFILTLILFSIYPLYLYIDGNIYKSKSEKLQKKLYNLNMTKNSLRREINILNKKISKIEKHINALSNKIKAEKELIESVYKFKFGYIPKSQQLVDITKLMNKYNIYLLNLMYENGSYILNIYSYKDENIAKFISNLNETGFNVYFDKIEYRNGKYYTTIRIEE